MDGERDLLAKGLREHTGVAERVEHDVTTCRQAVCPHGQEELSARRRQRVGGCLPKVFFEPFHRREGGAVFLDEASERAANTLPAESALEQREVNVATGLVPGAER